jgi:hypothetical protein
LEKLLNISYIAHFKGNIFLSSIMNNSFLFRKLEELQNKTRIPQQDNQPVLESDSELKKHSSYVHATEGISSAYFAYTFY